MIELHCGVLMWPKNRSNLPRSLGMVHALKVRWTASTVQYYIRERPSPRIAIAFGGHPTACAGHDHLLVTFNVERWGRLSRRLNPHEQGMRLN